MQSTKILSKKDTRTTIKQASTLLSETVGATLSPLGRNIGANLGYQTWVKHDGVSVAEQVNPEAPELDLVVRIMRESARNQVEAIGDGTTVTTILTDAIIQTALSLAEREESLGQSSSKSDTEWSVMRSARRLQQDLPAVIAQLREAGIPLATQEEATHVATISAENEELGKLVGTEVYTRGADGIIRVEPSKTGDTYVEHIEGMQFDSGWLTWQFVTEPSKMVSSLENPYVLVTNRPVKYYQDFTPLFTELVASPTRSLVVIAPEFGEDFLSFAILNKQQGVFNINCVKAPLMGALQSDFLQDIAILSGGAYYSAEANQDWKTVKLAELGSVMRATSSKSTTVLEVGTDTSEAITARIQAIKGQLLEATGFDHEKLKERLAKLEGGVSVIYVGGHTEPEITEKTERVIDAVAATQSALRGGIIPGGEVVYLGVKTDNPILATALQAPFRRLMHNANLNPELMMERVKASKVPNAGVNVMTGDICNMVESGILDPLDVAINALKAAVSVATQLFTMEHIIVPVTKEASDEK